jgi:hypothetical protein
MVDRALHVHRRSGTTSSQAQTWLIVPCTIGLLLVALQAVRSGTWLDEYWQLWVSNAPTAQLPARLVADAHPPWFNLFARLVVFMTGGPLIPARLINLAAAAAVLGLGLSRIRDLDSGLRWRIALLIVASGGAVGMTDLAASFRSYPWLLVLAGLQGALLAAIALRRPVPMVSAGVVTAASISLHYVNAAGAIAIAIVSVIVAWRSDRPATRAILTGLIAGVALDLAAGLTQLPHWRANLDTNWIRLAGGGGAADALIDVALYFLMGNVVSAILLATAVISHRSSTVLIILAPIPVALVGWLIQDAGAPIIVPRYLASVTALLATGAAMAWQELALRDAANMLVAGLASLQPLASSTIRPPLPGWEAGARVAAKVTEACPSARLYAVSPWRFRDAPESHTARFENPVIGFAYQQIGGRYGLKPDYVTGPTALVFDSCPAIVWMEAAHGIDRVPPNVILRHAQLILPGRARARVIPTPNGGVLLISSADRLQPRP